MCSSSRFFMGIDVQVKRGCPYAVFDEEGSLLKSSWLEDGDAKRTVDSLASEVSSIEDELGCTLAMGIDSPRMPLSSPRMFSWNRRQKRWTRLEDGFGISGRHCEVVVKTLNYANPQWTPIQGKCPDWMTLGFELFRALEGRKDVFEVFPSASYTMLDESREPEFRINLSSFGRGPKDMLDACIAAITVREFVQGRGCEVGGGDNLGSIILLRPLPHNVPASLLSWPEPNTYR